MMVTMNWPRFFRLVVVILLFGGWQISGVLAWDCNETHPAINELAGKLFIMKSQAGTFGDKYKQAPVEFRTTFPGTALKKGTMSENASIKEDMTGTLIEWLARGGHDADIPGFVMGFRHFYDPVYEPRYLTWFRVWLKQPDKKDFPTEKAFFDSFAYRAHDWNINKPLAEEKNVKLIWQPHVIRPKIDGITWALRHPDNDHSWLAGLRAYKAALEGDPAVLGRQTREQLFAKAFRALGETLHMLADMTQPAHTRADSHSVYEPIEKTVDGAMVRRIIGTSWKNVDFKPTQDFVMARGLAPETLMKTVASFTNRRFFSNDTIADYQKWVFPRNHKRPYPSPQLSKLKEIEGTYYSFFTDVGWVPLAKETGAWFSVVFRNKQKTKRKNPKFNVVPDMAEEQAKVLIPIAVVAGSELIDAFFPTLQAVVGTIGTGGPTPLFVGELRHVIERDPEWRNVGEIRYSGPGILQINGTRKVPCTFVSGKLDPLAVAVNPGDEVRLVVETGARIIRSDRFIVK